MQAPLALPLDPPLLHQPFCKNQLSRVTKCISFIGLSLKAQPGCGTAYPVTFVQQHLYMILNLTYVTTVLNEF